MKIHLIYFYRIISNNLILYNKIYYVLIKKVLCYIFGFQLVTSINILVCMMMMRPQDLLKNIIFKTIFRKSPNTHWWWSQILYWISWWSTHSLYANPYYIIISASVIRIFIIFENVRTTLTFADNDECGSLKSAHNFGLVLCQRFSVPAKYSSS